MPVKPTFTLCRNTWFPPRQVPAPQRRAGPLTCPAVVKLQRALDAEGLLAGATPVPVLAVDLVGGGAGSGGSWDAPPQGAAPATGPSPRYPPAQRRM